MLTRIFPKGAIDSTHLEHLPRRAEREDSNAYHQIGDGEGHDEQVRDRSQFGANVNGCDDKTIPDDDHNVDQEKNGENEERYRVRP